MRRVNARISRTCQLYRGEFWQHRNVYNGNGEYEFPTARHYFPQYWRGGGRHTH
jgi:hypothetical protein